MCYLVLIIDFRVLAELYNPAEYYWRSLPYLESTLSGVEPNRLCSQFGMPSSHSV